MPVLPMPPNVFHCALVVSSDSLTCALQLQYVPFVWPWHASLVHGVVLVNSPLPH